MSGESINGSAYKPAGNNLNYSDMDRGSYSVGADQAKSYEAKRHSFKVYDFVKEEFLKDDRKNDAKKDFNDEKIDLALIPSLLTSMFNKIDASNLKAAAEKIANTETRAKAATKESVKEMEEAARKRADSKEKEKKAQILEDVGLGFTTALMLLSLAALAFATGGMGLAIAGAAISGIMTAMDIANRVIKYDDKATFTDSKGNQKHIEISISGAVDAAIEKAIQNGDFHFPPGIDTPEDKEKYISQVKMGVSIAIQLTVMVVTISMSVASVKQAAQAVKDASGIAAKAVVGFKAAMTTTTEAVEAGVQVVAASTDAVKARKQYDIAIDARDANLAENKANANGAQADLLFAESRQIREVMAKNSESVRTMIQNVKKILDALAEMDAKIAFL